jgi:hypothetical protein
LAAQSRAKAPFDMSKEEKMRSKIFGGNMEEKN